MDHAITVETLSRSPLVTVYRCGHGCIHLSVGATTPQLTPAEF